MGLHVIELKKGVAVIFGKVAQSEVIIWVLDLVPADSTEPSRLAHLVLNLTPALSCFRSQRVPIEAVGMESSVAEEVYRVGLIGYEMREGDYGLSLLYHLAADRALRPALYDYSHGGLFLLVTSANSKLTRLFRLLSSTLCTG